MTDSSSQADTMWTFRAGREHITEDERPDHLLWIDRWPTGVCVVRREFLAQPAEPHIRSDPTRQIRSSGTATSRSNA